MIEYNCYFQILNIELDEALGLIDEVLNNKYENRAYQMYLSTLTIQALNGKYEDYPVFKSKILGKSNNSNSIKKKPTTITKKMAKEEKQNIMNQNNNILKLMKGGD